jgi:hypothetical protein
MFLERSTRSSTSTFKTSGSLVCWSMVRSLRRETNRTSNAYFESINLRRFGFRIDPTDRP